jgi:chromosome partitioning protein
VHAAAGMIARVSDTPPETAPTRGLLGRLRRPAGEDPAAPEPDSTLDAATGDDLPAGPPPAVPEGVAPSAPLPGADALDDLGLVAGDGDAASDGGDGDGPADDDAAGERQDARTVPQEGSGGRFARPLPRVMAVANQKGGVGKTTTTVNLSAALADLGFRVLIVDLDPQGNASTGVGINIRDLSTSVYDVLLHDAPMEDCIEATSVRNLYVAPANLDLAGAEIELVPAFSRELRLRSAIDSVRDDYDYILIDCPPSLGLLTVNSLAAASEVLVPIQCEYYALEGLGQLLRNVGLVQKNLNPTLEVSAILCVMYDARTKLADQVVAEVRSHFGDKVCRTVVPRTVRLSEAPSYGQPITAFDPSSRGSIAYKEVAKEVSGGTP